MRVRPVLGFGSVFGSRSGKSKCSSFSARNISEPAMRRFCAANPDARQPDFWCPTYDFAHFGMVNDYRLRCMCNHGDFNYLLMVYRKSSSQLNGKAA